MNQPSVEKAEILISAAKDASRQCRFEEALGIYIQVFTLSDLINSPEGLCQWSKALINQGVVFHKMGHYPQARESWLKVMEKPRDTPGLDYLQCVASGYLLTLVERSSPEWNQGWTQILNRYGDSQDIRIPGKLFEFCFGREWEFEGIKPGLPQFFQSLCGLWGFLNISQSQDVAKVYHSLSPEEKAQVLTHWSNAPRDWGRILWGDQGVWLVMDYEANWIRSRGKLEDQSRLSKRWLGNGGTLGKWPALWEKKSPRRSVLKMLPTEPPWIFFSDGTTSLGFEPQEGTGGFRCLDIRGNAWAALRKANPDTLILQNAQAQTIINLPEAGKLLALGDGGQWVIQGDSGAFYSHPAALVEGIEVPDNEIVQIFLVKNCLLALTHEGVLGSHIPDRTWNWDGFGKQQVLWVKTQAQGTLVASGTGSGVEIWDCKTETPQLVSKSPSPWDQGQWTDEGLFVYSNRAWGRYNFKNKKWEEQGIPGIIHGAWPVTGSAAYADRKGRWRTPEGPWLRGHGNWINGFSQNSDCFWTGDMEGQVLQWSLGGCVLSSQGPAPTLSADWLGKDSLVSFHPTFLQIWNTQGDLIGFYGHNQGLTALLVQDQKIWFGNQSGTLVCLDAMGKLLSTQDLGLGGITVLVAGKNSLGVGGSSGGWGVLDTRNKWTTWGTGGISALHPWHEGWLTGDAQGKLSHYTKPGESKTWPEVHREAVMALASQGDELYSAGADGRVLVWTGLGQLSEILRREKTPVWDLKPAGRVLLGRAEDRDLPVWNLPGTGGGKMAEGHRMALTSLDVHRDKTLCVTGGGEGWVRLWTLPDMQSLVRFDMGEPIARVKFSPEGKRLMVWTTKGNWSLWDLSPALILVGAS